MSINKNGIICIGTIVYLLGCIYSPAAKENTGGAKENKKKQIAVSLFRITNQVSGWKEIEDTYKLFNPAGLYEIIDGGADFYIEFELKKGIYQRLKASKQEQCDIFVEDFGSKENAKKIFNAKKEQISEPLPIDQFKSNDIIAEGFIGAVSIYMYIDKFYFELSFSGFDSKEDALKKASPIIKYYLEIAGP